MRMTLLVLSHRRPKVNWYWEQWNLHFYTRHLRRSRTEKTWRQINCLLRGCRHSVIHSFVLDCGPLSLQFSLSRGILLLLLLSNIEVQTRRSSVTDRNFISQNHNNQMRVPPAFHPSHLRWFGPVLRARWDEPVTCLWWSASLGSAR